MFAVVLASALLAQAVLGAPSNCAEYCDDQGTSSSGIVGSSGGYSSSSGLYSSNYRSSYDRRLSRVSGSSRSGLGLTGDRLENLDENVITGSGVAGPDLGSRPGNWHDEKHYVTDDGRGQMSYRAGQTVTDNGYSKFAEHSYSYGSHDSHAPLSNSQVLSTAEFNRELQNMRQRIASFMGNFHVGADSIVSANLLQDFKSKANLISNQLTDVCNQVDVGSSMYRQMQQMQQQFQQDVERIQQQMEAKIYQTASSSLSAHGSVQLYPSTRPSTTLPSAPLQQYPVPRPTPVPEEVIAQQQRVEEEITKVYQQISSFYTTFNRPDTDVSFQQNLNNQASEIELKIAELNLQAVENKSARARIEHMKTQFEEYVAQLRNRIQEVENRRREAEKKRLEEELLQETQRYEESKRLIEQKRLLLQQQQQEEENRRLREQAEQLKKQEAEERRLREQAERLKYEEEERRQELARLQRIQAAEQIKLQQQQQQQQQQPQVSGSLEVSGQASYEHNIKTTYGSGIQGSSGSYVQQQQQQQQQQSRVQPQLNAHVDLTALTSRLQQELNRLQNEVNNYNTYTMRLTAANSASVVAEAERQADSLRQSINNLCETSGRYHNQNIQTNAEELSRRFEEMFRSLREQAANYAASGSSGAFSASAGFSSHSSYGTSGSVGAIRAPAITNVEYEHSKSTEVEIGKRPSQRYSSGYGQQQVECVEAYAGQPCVEQQPRRYRRQALEYGPFFDLPQIPDYDQQYQPIFGDIYASQPEENPAQWKIGPKFGVLSFGPPLGNPQAERSLQQFTDNIALIGQPGGYEPARRESFDKPVRKPPQQPRNLQHRIQDLSHQEDASDGYYTRRPQPQQHQQHPRPAAFEAQGWSQKPEYSLQQQQGVFEQSDDLEQQPRSRYFPGTQRTREQIPPPKPGTLNVVEHSTQPIGFRESGTRPVYKTEKPAYRPAATFGRPTSEDVASEKPRYYDSLEDNDKPEQVVVSRSQFAEVDDEEPITMRVRGKPLAFGKAVTRESSLRGTSGLESGNQESGQSVVTTSNYETNEGNSDFGLSQRQRNDYSQRSGTGVESRGNLRPIPVFMSTERPKYIPKAGGSTPEESGFYDYPNQNGKSEASAGSSRPIVEKAEFDQSNGQSGEQQGGLRRDYARDEKTENFDEDFTQRTDGRENLHSEGQVGRQDNLWGTFRPETSSSPVSNQNVPSKRKHDNDEIEHPSGTYISSLRQQNQQSSANIQSLNDDDEFDRQPYNIQDIFGDEESKQLENDDSRTEKVVTSTEREGLRSTAYPASRPILKPIPRYTRPWQVGQTDVVPKQSEYGENTNTDYPIDNSSNGNINADIEKSSGPRRGDLPGHSEPPTPPVVDETPIIDEEPAIEEEQVTEQETEQPEITEKPHDYQKPTINYNFTQQYEQVNLHENNQSLNLPKPKIECQNSSDHGLFSQSSQAYFQHQQRYHHNYQYSQRSNFYSQHSARHQIDQQNPQPITQQSVFIPFRHLAKPEFDRQQESYQFREHQTSSFKPQLQQEAYLRPKLFDGNKKFEFDKQSEFGQQIQEPVAAESSQLQFSHRQNSFIQEQTNSQNSKENFSNGITTNMAPIQPWSETEPTSTSRTIWKRIGHKLSYSYDKAKEGAKSIFG